MRDDSSEAARRPAGPVPVSTGTSTPYIDYGSIDVLLSLQHPRSPEPAELGFHVLTQVQELLFKLLYEDLRRVGAMLDADDARAATRALYRLRRVTDVLNSTWDVLDTLAPTEFARLRPGLGEASGVQSYMFRMVEFTLGRKAAAYVSLNAHVPGVAAALRQALERPSVYDAALALLRRRGLPVPESLRVPDEACVRGEPRAAADTGTGGERAGAEDAGAPGACPAGGASRAGAEPPPDPRIEAAWARVYREQAPGDELFELAEALVALAEGVSRWRLLHLLTAERVLGDRPGTGGSDGVPWLRRSAGVRYFPELWSARALI